MLQDSIWKTRQARDRMKFNLWWALFGLLEFWTGLISGQTLAHYLVIAGLENRSKAAPPPGMQWLGLTSQLPGLNTMIRGWTSSTLCMLQNQRTLSLHKVPLLAQTQERSSAGELDWDKNNQPWISVLREKRLKGHSSNIALQKPCKSNAKLPLGLSSCAP